mgnify:CR=1 FL=1
MLVVGEDTCQNQMMLAGEQLIEKENPPLGEKIEGVAEVVRSASVFAALFTLFLMICRAPMEMANMIQCGC